jgi:hypothetical protein
MTDKDARDPLHIDNDDPLKRDKLLLPTIQSSKNAFPITSIIAKDNKSTYNKFLRHIFEFGQECRDSGTWMETFPCFGTSRYEEPSAVYE